MDKELSRLEMIKLIAADEEEHIECLEEIHSGRKALEQIGAMLADDEEEFELKPFGTVEQGPSLKLVNKSK